MKIFIPYTNLKIEIPTNAIAIFMEDENAYSRYFIQRWKEGGKFINIEQDVIVTDDQLKEIWECENPWCVISYAEDDPTPYFGCVKFDTDKLPQVWVERPWGNCDCFFVEKMRELNILPHIHKGACKHLHIYN